MEVVAPLAATVPFKVAPVAPTLLAASVVALGAQGGMNVTSLPFVMPALLAPVAR
jgi:hypothetical protein